MNDLDAARLICVILQKLESGEKNLKKLTAQKQNLEAKPVWFETRDCPVWTDTELRYERLLPEPPCPFSQEYINSHEFQRMLDTYNRKRRRGEIGVLGEILYEDQISYTKYLKLHENISQKNSDIIERNENRRKKSLVNEANKKTQTLRKQEAYRKRNEQLAWYTSMIFSFEKGIKAAKTIRDMLYDEYRVFHEVRNLESMSEIYEYLWSNQAATIGDATYKYRLMGKVNCLIEILRGIVSNQSVLQQSVADIGQKNELILEQLKDLNTMSANMGGALKDINETLNTINMMKLGDV